MHIYHHNLTLVQIYDDKFVLPFLTVSLARQGRGKKEVRMHRKWRAVASLLLAATALGLASPSLAQTPPNVLVVAELGGS